METRNGRPGLSKWMLAALILCVPLVGAAQVGISITIAPPPLPVYEQPPIPEPGYLWTPGYWAYGPEGYFWVPGTWVMPPEAGLLWTPGYWGWSDGLFVWNQGYWAPAVGFYGGVNYGFGYYGRGYEGGYWRDRQFYYNRAVNNVTNVQVQNVYNRTVINNVTVDKISYAGGPGGLAARPSAQEEQAARQRHMPPTSVQWQHRDSAGSMHELLAAVNHGAPPIAATAKPNDFSTRSLRMSSASGPRPATAPGDGAAREPSAEQHAVGSNAPQPAQPSTAHSSPTHAPVPPAVAPSGSVTAQDRPAGRPQAQVQTQQEREHEALTQQQHGHASPKQPPPAATAPQPQGSEREHPPQSPPSQQAHAAERQPKPPPPAPRGQPEPPHDSHEHSGG
jgi:hypothetical protein